MDAVPHVRVQDSLEKFGVVDIFNTSDFAKGQCGNSEPSYIDFPAHSAPLGLAFIPGEKVVNTNAIAQKLTTSGLWPGKYQGDLLVAYHGSWNRTMPTGYKVVRFDLGEKGESKGESDFLSGFLQGNSALGRPVDLLFDEKGVLFISDDKAGVIYKIEVK